MYRILKSDCEHGPFYDTWSYLYERLTTKPLPQVLGANDRAAVRLLPGLDAYVDILYAACGETNRPGIVARGSARTYDLPASKKALVAFSGGKDSVATAISLRKEYDVKLYHLSGINHGYSHERNYCDELASMLGLPLVVRNVHIKVEKGCPFKENPVKNQLIQAAMLEYGLPTASPLTLLVAAVAILKICRKLIHCIACRTLLAYLAGYGILPKVCVCLHMPASVHDGDRGLLDHFSGMPRNTSSTKTHQLHYAGVPQADASCCQYARRCDFGKVPVRDLQQMRLRISPHGLVRAGGLQQSVCGEVCEINL